MHIMKRKSTRIGLVAAALAAGIAVSADSCDGPESASQKEAASRNSSYNSLTASQPAHKMTYSPTRATINFWIDTWNTPGKLSYVYLQGADGTLVGYYVLKGLPVSYCAGLTPPYTQIGTPDDGDSAKDNVVAAPSVDGVYYSGAQCNSFFGQDATTGAYIEYTVGQGQNVLLYDQPLPQQKAGNAQPLGPTTTEAAAKLPQPATGAGK